MTVIDAPTTAAEGNNDGTRVIGHRRVRLEDPRLLSGEAEYSVMPPPKGCGTAATARGSMGIAMRRCCT